VVNDDSVSAEHCQISNEGMAFLLQDRFSRNGTFLNGMRVDKVAMLQHGDVIRVGQTDIVFKVEQTRERT
jgi:pSer/pThr/pTyr-binding forkhead associated (FHA) protein